jgi:hypothetical protein
MILVAECTCWGDFRTGFAHLLEGLFTDRCLYSAMRFVGLVQIGPENFITGSIFVKLVVV